MASAVVALLSLGATTAGAQTTNAFLVGVPSPVAPGGKLAYVATIINDGTAAKDYDLDLSYDPHLSFQGAVALSGTSGVGSCLPCTSNAQCPLGTCKDSGICTFPGDMCVVDTSGGAGTSWTLGNVAAGRSLSLQLEHDVSAATPLTDPATQTPRLLSTLVAAEYQSGGSLGQPTTTESRTGVFADAGAAPLFVDFTDTPLEVEPGDELVYRLTIMNRGAFSRFLGIYLDYDSNLSFVDHHTDDSSCIPFLIAPCVSPIPDPDLDFIAIVDPGDTITLRLRLTVDPGTTRTELTTGLRVIDSDTMRGVEEEERTPVLACKGQPNGAACDNGDVCSGDMCSGESCVPAACPQACVGAPDGAPCADANACTVEECQSGQCVAKTTTSGSPIQIRCRACESCDPALACQLVPAVDQKVCRAPFGSCDAAEICNGADSTCPDDVFKPVGSMCDDGNSGTISDQCVAQPQGPPRCVGSPDPCGNATTDPGEQCDDGNQEAGDCCSPACQYEAAGAPCPDATVCNGAETCDGAGQCQAGTALVCDPGTICTTAGQCDPIAGCQFPPAPAVGCHTGFADASLAVNEVRAGFERLRLDLKTGPALNPAEFGNPTLPGGSAYTVCVYRKDNGAFAGDLQLDRAGTTCGARPCWKPLPFGKGFQYTDRSYATDGIGAVRLASSSGQSQIQFSGRNNAKKGQASLPAGLNPPGIAKGLDRSFAGARVQIRRDDGGACFEADLGTVIRSGPTYFRAKN